MTKNVVTASNGINYIVEGQPLGGWDVSDSNGPLGFMDDDGVSTLQELLTTWAAIRGLKDNDILTAIQKASNNSIANWEHEIAQLQKRIKVEQNIRAQANQRFHELNDNGQ